MRRSSAHRAYKVASGSISNVENLAAALGLTTLHFEKLWEIPEELRYSSKTIPKLSGELREVHNPCRELRIIQRRINTRIFSNPDVVKWPNYLYGSLPKGDNPEDEFNSRDYVACAKLHCQAKSILKLDIKDFFSNVHDDLIMGVFSEVLKYPDVVSQVLTRVCTYKTSLVQGALTSSYLAMLSLYGAEDELVHRLRKKNLIYTRFVDDITISSKVANYDFSYAARLVEQMLVEKGLPLNTKKTITQYASLAPLTVHGLRVCFAEPRLPADEVRRIRAAVQSIEIVAKEKNYRQTYPYRKDFNRCMGRVNKLARVGHNQHCKFISRLHKILPLPSAREVEYVKAATLKLESLYATKRESFWYKKLYYRVGDRLNLVGRSFPNLAKSLRERLREVKPAYE